MKKFYFTLVTFLFLAVVNAQIVNIPDPVFKQQLLLASPSYQIASTQNPIYDSLTGEFTISSYNTVDTNNDGEIQVSEANAIKCLRFVGSFIQSLEGISSFSNLQYLYCSNNSLTSLNASSLTSLQYLGCYNNHISSINVSGLTNLLNLDCYTNNQLPSLNVSGLTNLKSLRCIGTQLTSLNVSGLTNLQWLYCGFIN